MHRFGWAFLVCNKGVELKKKLKIWFFFFLILLGQAYPFAFLWKISHLPAQEKQILLGGWKTNSTQAQDPKNLVCNNATRAYLKAHSLPKHTPQEMISFHLDPFLPSVTQGLLPKPIYFSTLDTKTAAESPLFAPDSPPPKIS